MLHRCYSCIKLADAIRLSYTEFVMLSAADRDIRLTATALERNGWLARARVAAPTCARQTFRITSEGRKLLADLRRAVTELGSRRRAGKAGRRPQWTET